MVPAIIKPAISLIMPRVSHTKQPWPVSRETRLKVGTKLTSYSPIARGLFSTSMDSAIRVKNINIIRGLKHILKVHSCLMKLASQCPVGWSITKVVMSRLREENRGKVYQGCELHKFRDTTIKTCADLT